MIEGALYHDDRTRYCIQTNNPTEQILRKRREADWLESCGPTAAVNCLSALGHNVAVLCPGAWQPQPEEILLDWFHDPRNARFVGSVEMPNRVLSLYVPAVEAVFGIQTIVVPLRLDALREYLETNHAVQLLLKQPGHYIAAVAWDSETEEILYWDSWPDRFADKDGFNKRMSSREYQVNTHPTGVLYPRRPA